MKQKNHKQESTILGACNYSIATLDGIRKTLLDYGNPKKELNWAVGGLIITLSTQLLRICHERIMESVAVGEPNARDDIKFIQSEFNKFIDGMINHE